jgi:hypothetical protein
MYGTTNIQLHTLSLSQTLYCVLILYMFRVSSAHLQEQILVWVACTLNVSCMASPVSPDLLNISCARISWSSVRIRIGLICDWRRQEWMAWYRSVTHSAVRTFPCPWPTPRRQCDCVVPAGLSLAVGHCQGFATCCSCTCCDRICW